MLVVEGPGAESVVLIMTELSEKEAKTKFRVAKLDATNDWICSKKMEAVLRGKDLWNVVSGDEEKPTATASNAK